jgi:hypothetical protein
MLSVPRESEPAVFIGVGVEVALAGVHGVLSSPLVHAPLVVDE